MKKIFLSILFGLFLSSVFSQQVITAKIMDAENSRAVSNAVITIQGDTAHFYSNKLGYFQVTATTNDFLIISHEGYETGKIQVPPHNSFAIRLNPIDEATITQVENNNEKGQIVNGYKAGVWEYYESGHVVLKFDYDRSEILYLIPDTTEYAVEINRHFEMKNVDRQPYYIGSERDIMGVLARNIQYPEEAIQGGVNGTLNIAFTIGEDGHIKDFEVFNDIGYGCGESAIAAMKQIPDTWIPALIDGKPYPARFLMPVTFVLKGFESSDKAKEGEDSLPIATSLDEYVVTAIRR